MLRMMNWWVQGWLAVQLLFLQQIIALCTSGFVIKSSCHLFKNWLKVTMKRRLNAPWQLHDKLTTSLMGYLHVKEALQHLKKHRAPLHWVAGGRSIQAKAHLTDEKKLAQVLQFHQLQELVKQSSSCKEGQTKWFFQQVCWIINSTWTPHVANNQQLHWHIWLLWL